jgi:hypothetical protein
MFWLSVASVIAGIAWQESKREPPVLFEEVQGFQVMLMLY